MIAGRWHTNFIITAVVFFTVIIGLLLAQLDFISVEAAPTYVAVVEASETAVSPTETVLAVVPIPTTTPSPTTGGDLSEEDVDAPAAEPTLRPKYTNTPIPDSQQLPCMTAPSNWVPYVVQRGDTLLSISVTFGATQEELSQFNCLTSRNVSAGMTILVPSVPPTSQPCGVPPSWWRAYTVKRGDTLFSLARFRGVTVYDVINANCLKTTSLFAGQVIQLPPQSVITATPTLMPTTTATASLTPTATAPTPSATPTLDGSQTPTVTPSPSATVTVTATPSETPQATASPEMTATAVSSETPTPAPTEESTPEPTVESTPIPTEMPTMMPTSTPLPTAEPTPISDE